jgi:hypothetical protein
MWSLTTSCLHVSTTLLRLKSLNIVGPGLVYGIADSVPCPTQGRHAGKLAGNGTHGDDSTAIAEPRQSNYKAIAELLKWQSNSHTAGIDRMVRRAAEVGLSVGVSGRKVGEADGMMRKSK